MITKAEQQEMFREYQTPPHVQRHCNEVARVARVIAEALNRKGYSLNVDEIYGAAMVHDVVRTRKDHDIEGAKILIERCHPEEAELVRRHMRYHPFHSADQLEEIDILCLADRTVREDEYVGVDERIEYLLHKPNFSSPEAKNGIEQARLQTKELVRGIEEILGESFDDLCRKPENAASNS